jgi:hypothetical protein
MQIGRSCLAACTFTVNWTVSKISLVLTISRNHLYWIVLIISISCTSEQPILVSQLLTATVSCPDLSLNSQICTSTTKLIIPFRLDLGSRKLKKVEVDSIFMEINPNDSYPIVLHNIIITFRTQTKILFGVLPDDQVYSIGSKLKLNVSKDQMRILESTLLSDHEVLVMTAFKVSQNVENITLKINASLTTSYE